MRLMLAAAAAVAISPAATARIAADDAVITPMPNPGALLPKCQRSDRFLARGPKANGAQKLGDMPPAMEIKAVYRSAGGCPYPLVVRNEVGMPKADVPRPGR